MCLTQRAEPKKQSVEWIHTDFPLKKKVPGRRPVKKVILIVLWDMQRAITIAFMEKFADVNSTSYC